MQQTTSAYFKALNILFAALIAGQILFAIITYVLKSTGTFPNNESLMPVLIYFVPALNLICILASHISFKKNIAVIDANDSLNNKLNIYRALCIKRMAIIEGGTIFSIIAYLLTGAQPFLVFIILMLMVFLTIIPNVKRLLKELPLSSAEQDVMNDPNGVIV